jgi:hypothetical protein
MSDTIEDKQCYMIYCLLIVVVILLLWPRAQTKCGCYDRFTKRKNNKHERFKRINGRVQIGGGECKDTNYDKDYKDAKITDGKCSSGCERAFSCEQEGKYSDVKCKDILPVYTAGGCSFGEDACSPIQPDTSVICDNGKFPLSPMTVHKCVAENDCLSGSTLVTMTAHDGKGASLSSKDGRLVLSTDNFETFWALLRNGDYPYDLLDFNDTEANQIITDGGEINDISFSDGKFIITSNSVNYSISVDKIKNNLAGSKSLGGLWQRE